MEVRVMLNEEREKLEKEKAKEEIRNEENVVNDLFKNNKFFLRYVENTYNLESKYRESMPYRITLFEILDLDTSNVSVGIDVLIQHGVIQLYGELVSGLQDLIINPHIETCLDETNYKDSNIYKDLMKILCRTSLTDTESFLKDIVLNFKLIAHQLSMLSFKYNRSSKINYEMNDLALKRNFDFIVSENTISNPIFVKKLTTNVCTPDNIIYPLYYTMGYRESSKNRVTGLPDVVTPTNIIFEEKEIYLAREDKYDILNRDLKFKYRDGDIQSENIITSNKNDLINININTNDKDRLAINMIKQLPTHIIELALAVKRVFGEKTAMCKGKNGKGVGIFNEKLGIVVQLYQTENKEKYYNIEYRVDSEYYTFLIDIKDLMAVLKILIKYYSKKVDVLNSDLVLIHDYISTYINPTTYRYDFLHFRNSLNDNYSLDEYNDEEEEDQSYLVQQNIKEEIANIIKYGKYESEDIMYHMDVNDKGELYIIVDQFNSNNKIGIEESIKRGIITDTNNPYEYHGNLIAFKVCLEDDVIVFNPIKNHVLSNYSKPIYSYVIMSDEKLKELVEPITEGVFMDVIKSYIDFCKEIDMEHVFKIK